MLIIQEIRKNYEQNKLSKTVQQFVSLNIFKKRERR